MKKLILFVILLNVNLISQASNESAGFPCNPTRFFALNTTHEVEELEVVGGAVVSHGIVLTGVPGTGLAYCNNVDGGAYSPTFYSYTSTNISHYNGSTWDTINFAPQTYMSGIGGNGNYLYVIQPSAGHPFIYSYNAGVLTGLSVNVAPAVADVAADEDGNIWYFSGSTQLATRIRQLSPTGTLLKEFICNINSYNAFGCFLLNGVMYLGLGSLNTVYPNSLIPITFVQDSAYVGTPMILPSPDYNDFASCSPGRPISVEENSFDRNLVLYPNPASSLLTISTTLREYTYNIYDTRGSKIKSGFVNAPVMTIDIEKLNNGIYFIECTTSNGILRRKFIKQ